jgi:hypothetical protein
LELFPQTFAILNRLAADVQGGLVARLLAAVLIFGCLEGVIFHSGLYASIIEPDSTTGFMELQLQNEIRRPRPNRNQVLAVGHSRQALLPRIANQMQPSTGYTFATIGLGGTTPRDWYYELRSVDPHAHNYAAIVIPEDDYNEPDSWEDQSDRESDLHYLIARLRLRDLGEFPWTYKKADRRWAAFEGILLKGTVYKQDFQEFLDHPLARIAKAEYYRRESAGWYYGFGGDARTLAGMEIDWAHKTARFPPNVSEADQKRISDELFSEQPPDQGREVAYRLFWYRKMLDFYRGSGTKLVYLRVPRAPVSPPDVPPKLNSAVRQIAREPDVIVLDEHLLDSLERPELLWDSMHLNREGQIRFTEIVAGEVRKALGPPKP